MPEFPFFLELHQSVPSFFYIRAWVGPMYLIEINHFCAKPAQTVVRLAPDRSSFETSGDSASIVPDHATFRKHIGPRRDTLQCARNYFFRMTQPIDCGGIDPIYTRVNCRTNRLNGL